MSYKFDYRLLQKNFAQPMGYTIAAGALGKSGLFPSTFGEALHYSGAEMTTSPSSYPLRHDSTCPRMASGRRQQQQPLRETRERSRSSGCLEKSITSIHSSGQDSGIVDGALHCHCGQSSSQSSEDSSK